MVDNLNPEMSDADSEPLFEAFWFRKPGRENRNYLGQSEDVTVKANVALDDDGLSKSLRELGKELESDE